MKLKDYFSILNIELSVSSGGKKEINSSFNNIESSMNHVGTGSISFGKNNNLKDSNLEVFTKFW